MHQDLINCYLIIFEYLILFLFKNIFDKELKNKCNGSLEEISIQNGPPKEN